MNTPNKQLGAECETKFVSAPAIAKVYGVTSRYILQLAAANRIPCLRIGKKCVRFDPKRVAAAIEKESSLIGD